MPCVEVEGLMKIYRGGVRAVDGLSFRVDEGEAFALLGPNGAGKTTTLRILAGILKPDSGTAKIFGIDVSQDPLRAREFIGYVPEITGLYERLNPFETLVFFGQIRGLPAEKAKKRALELIERLGLEEHASKLNGALSRGNAQKLVVAIALMGDAPLLILDEPTSGLDVLATRAVREIIAEERKKGKTIVFSSHIMSEVEKVCERVLVINKGKAVAEGRIAEIKERWGDLEEMFVQAVRGGDGR